MILEAPKIKSDTVSTVSPSICHEVMEPDAMIQDPVILSKGDRDLRFALQTHPGS